MRFILFVFILLASVTTFADSWIYQVKEKELRGITLTSYLDENGLEHFKIGHFAGAKSIEKESVTKSEYIYQVNYGAMIKKDLKLSPNDVDCHKNLHVIQNNSTRICYRMDTKDRDAFYEWHDYLQKYILSKEEKDNLILRRHLKKP